MSGWSEAKASLALLSGLVRPAHHRVRARRALGAVAPSGAWCAASAALTGLAANQLGAGRNADPRFLHLLNSSAGVAGIQVHAP